MASGGEFQDKIDTLDLIIRVLKDHEQKLDEISSRLAGILGETAAEEEREEPIIEEFLGETPVTGRISLVTYSGWDKFKAGSQKAIGVAFQADKTKFSVYSVTDARISRYMEELPKDRIIVSEGEDQYSIENIKNLDDLSLLLSGTLRCGLDVAIQVSQTLLPGRRTIFELEYTFDAKTVKDFLSQELSVPRERIVEGISF